VLWKGWIELAFREEIGEERFDKRKNDAPLVPFIHYDLPFNTSNGQVGERPALSPFTVKSDR